MIMSEQTREKYYNPILASINAAIDPFLNLIDSLDLMDDKSKPSQAEIDNVKNMINELEDLRMAFMKNNMSGKQESQLIMVLKQMQENMNTQVKKYQQAEKEMKALLKICNLSS